MGKLTHHKRGTGNSKHVAARRYIAHPSADRSTTDSGSPPRRVGHPFKNTLIGSSKVVEHKSTNDDDESALFVPSKYGQSSITSSSTTYKSSSTEDSNNKPNKVHEDNHSHKLTSQAPSAPHVKTASSALSPAFSTKTAPKRATGRAKNRTVLKLIQVLTSAE